MVVTLNAMGMIMLPGYVLRPAGNQTSLLPVSLQLVALLEEGPGLISSSLPPRSYNVTDLAAGAISSSASPQCHAVILLAHSQRAKRRAR